MAILRTIRQPNKGEEVKALQRLLHLKEDGIFGPQTTEAVKEYQAWHGLTPDGVVGPRTWEVLLRNESGVEQRGKDDGDGGYVVNDVDLSDVRPTRRRTINEIIIHCTATPEGREVSIAELTKWHKQRGFSDIGYQYVIGLDGKIRNGRNIDIAGAHCTGHNTHSIGVVYVGGLAADGKTAKDTRTEAQRKSLNALLCRLCVLYPKARLYGHRELSKDQNGDGVISPWEWEKQCPSFDVLELRKKLREAKIYRM